MYDLMTLILITLCPILVESASVNINLHRWEIIQCYDYTSCVYILCKTIFKHKISFIY